MAKNGNTSKNIIISGTAFWASLVRPNVKFAPTWQIDVCNLDDNTVKSLKSEGLKVKKDDERGSYISLKRRVVKADNSRKDPPIVVDSRNNPWDDTVLIGNDSKVNVKFHTYTTEQFGTHAELDKVQVIELVKYGSPEPEFPVYEKGYVVGKDDEIPF